MGENICPVITVFFQAFEDRMRSLQPETFSPPPTKGIVLLPVNIMQIMLMLTCGRL